ncbi:hypothetical protein KCU74_g110, partial [Aureobasidium melanogenum]
MLAPRAGSLRYLPLTPILAFPRCRRPWTARLRAASYDKDEIFHPIVTCDVLRALVVAPDQPPIGRYHGVLQSNTWIEEEIEKFVYDTRIQASSA